jgi:repressor LexA
MEFTNRRKAICKFLAKFKSAHGYGPTIRQIGAGVGIASTSAVMYQINQLERLGKIRRERGVSRSILLASELRARRVRYPRSGTSQTRAAVHAQ